jgi:hypothetical protein
VPEGADAGGPWSKKEFDDLKKRIATEHTAIMSGIGRLTTHWGMLETALYKVFSSLNGIGETEPSGDLLYAQQH